MAKVWHRRCKQLFAAWVIAWLYASPAVAELKTHQIKAAYLYQISKFVFWPESRKNVSQFEVCQLGKDQYGGILDKMSGRLVFSKPVVVKSVKDLNEAKNCHLLVISSPETIKTEALRKWLKTHQALTVVDGNEYWDKGMVTFVLEKHRVRLHINLSLAEHSGLSFAANLLEVASHIYRGGPK